MRLNETANREAIDKTAVRVASFVYLDIPGDPVRANTSALDVVTGGHTWTGIGQFGGIQVIAEDTEINAAPIQLSLSGIPSALLTDILTADYRNRAVELSLGFFDQDWVLLAPLESIWTGVIDSAQVKVGTEFAEIVLTCENELSFLIGRPIPIRYTDQEQRKRFAGDRFFQLLPSQFNLSLEWGGTVTNMGGGGGSGDDLPRERNLA